MKSPILTCSILLLSVSMVRAANFEALNEVLKLKNSGVEQDVIVTFVKAKNLSYELTAEDILTLQKEGFSSEIINAMLVSGLTNPVAPVDLPASSGAVQKGTNVTTVIVAPGVPPQPATTIAISADAAYFHQELSQFGRWMLTEENEWCWQPSVAATSSEWRPYVDKGHWEYTDSGWYWASDYEWGWAAFHYGRWRLHPRHGWVWFADRVWGPAWVVWREGGDYCGWAPLPPGAAFDVFRGDFLWKGARVSVDFDFGLDWNHFTFTLVRELGSPSRVFFRKPEERRKFFVVTKSVTRYTILKAPRSEGHMHIVNHGIEPVTVRAKGGRTIEVIKIGDLRAPLPKGRHEKVDRRQGVIEVYRPRFQQNPPRK